MIQVDFYNLPTINQHDYLTFACKLINKAWQHNLSSYIHCQDGQQRQLLNQLLWEFKADSFLPHNLLEEQNKSPILLGVEETDYQAIQHPLLINLSFKPPKHHQQFQRIIEFVTSDNTVKEQARQNYRFYQELQYTIQYHSIATL